LREHIIIRVLRVLSRYVTRWGTRTHGTLSTPGKWRWLAE